MVFAHFNREANKTRDNRWTTLVKFDAQWRRQAGWTFPSEVLRRFHPDSCSGGAWSADGRLLCSGHDRGELYWLELPRAGSVLQLKAAIPCPITGQGFAFDPAAPDVLYGVDRPRRQVVVAKFVQ